MITLKIPEGNYCERCMFLDEGEAYEKPRCRLFGNQILGFTSWNNFKEDILKCEQCPKEEETY